MAGDEITVKVSKSDIQKAIASLKKYQLIKRQGTEDILKSVAFMIEADAKGLVPVDMGRLKSSISVGVSGGTASGHKDKVDPPPGAKGLVVIVGTKVKYGAKMEFGVWPSDVPKPGKGEYPKKSKKRRKDYAPQELPTGGFLYLTKAYYANEPKAEKRIKKLFKKKFK